MTLEVEIAPAAGRELRKLPGDIVSEFAAAIDLLKEDPMPCGYKKLRMKINKIPAYRVRLGDYRLVYTFDSTKLVILRARIRARAYDKS